MKSDCESAASCPPILARGGLRKSGDDPTDRDRAIAAVLIFFFGLRPNEAFALRWQDVDFYREQLRIRRSRRKPLSFTSN